MELVKLVNLNAKKTKVKLRCESAGTFEGFTTGKVYTPIEVVNEFGYVDVKVIDDFGYTIYMCLNFDELKKPKPFAWSSEFKILCMPEVG